MADNIAALKINLDIDSAGFTQSMQDINRKLKGLNSEFKATAGGNKEFENSLDGMKAKSENLGKQFQLQQQRVSSLKQEYDKIVQSQGANSKAAENLLIRYNNAVAGMKKTESALQSVNGKISDAENKWKQLGKAANDAAEKVGATGEKMKNAGGSLTAGLTAPIAGFGVAALKTASDFDSSAGRIQGQLGVTSDEAEKLNGVAQSMWKEGFGDSIKGVADNVVMVKQNMDELSDAEIREITESAMNLEELFGTGVSETTRAAGIMMSNFGDTGQHSMDVLTVGMQKAGSQGDDLLDTFTEYSPQFAALGLSSEQAMNLLVQGLDAGARNTDVLADTMKEFTIEAEKSGERVGEGYKRMGLDGSKMMEDIAAGGDRANNAFFATIAGLSAMEDETARNIAGAEIFGTKWEDVKDSALLALDPTKNALGEVEGATKKAGDAVNDNFGTRLQATWRSAQEALLPLGNTLLDLAEKYMPKVESVIGKVSNAFANMSPTLQNATVIFGLLLAAIGPVLTAIGFMISGIAPLIPMFVTVFGWVSKVSGIIGLLGKAFALLSNPIGWAVLAIGGLTAAFVIAYQKSETFRNIVNGVWDSIKNAWSATVTWLTKSVPETMGKIGQWFSNAKDDSIKKFNEMKSGITNSINNTLSNVSNKVTEMKNNVTSRATELKDNAVNRFNDLKSKVENTVTAWKNNTVNLFNTAKNDVTNRVNNLRDNVQNAFSNARTKVENTVSGLKTRAVTLFTEMKNDVVNRAGLLRDNVYSAFTTAKTKVEGVIGNIKTSVSGLWTDIVNGAKSLPGKIGSGISSMASNVVSGIKTMINKMASWLGKGVNGAIDGINWVLGKINVDKISKWKVPAYAKGTDGHPGGLAMINDGKGSNFKELVQTPDGQVSMFSGRNVVTDLPKGTKVLSGDKTKNLMQSMGIPRYEDGIGDIFSFLDKPKELMQKLYKKFIPSIDLSGAFGDVAKGGVSYIKDKSIDFVKDKMKDLFSFDGFAGGNASAWRPAIIKAAMQMGQSITDSQINGIIAQIHRESGGNQKIIQSSAVWDVNTAAGNPARGLLQYIPQTFAAYKVPGYNDIYNGYHQLLAFFNNNNWRKDLPYGKRGWGPTGARKYANGGIITTPHMGLVGEAGDEAIIPLSLGKRTRALDLWSKVGNMLGVSMENMQIPSFSGSGATNTNNNSTQNFNVTLNYSGSGSHADVMQMADVLETELSRRANIKMAMKGV